MRSSYFFDTALCFVSSPFNSSSPSCQIEEFLALCKQTYRETYANCFTEKELDSIFGDSYKAELHGGLDSVSTDYIVAFWGDKMIGYAKVSLLPSIEFTTATSEVAYLSKIYFLQAYQGQGFGKKLLQYCCQKIPKHI